MAIVGSLSYCVILPSSGLSQLSHIIILYEKCLSQKRGLLSLLLDRAEQTTSSHRPSLSLPTSSALGNSVWTQLQYIFLWEKRGPTTLCLTDCSSVSSGAAGKLRRKRHDIKSQLLIFAELLTVKVSLSLMPRCVATDSVRELNKCNMPFGRLQKDINKCQSGEVDLRYKGSHCLVWRCLTCF